MKKYRISEKVFQEVLPYFFHSGYLDSIMISEIDSVLNYLNRRSKKDIKKAYILMDQEYKAIAIIDKLRQTCYVYTNCGINFDINFFFTKLFNKQKDFSAICCDELLYNRMIDFIYENHIIFNKHKDVYSMTSKEIMNVNQNNQTIVEQTIILNRFVFNLFYSVFIKIIDEHTLLVINHNYAAMISIHNSQEFINQFYTMTEKVSKVYLDSQNEIYLEGATYQLKDNVYIYDFDETIHSIVVIRNATTCYEIIYANSIYKDFLAYQLNLIINQFRLENDQFYFVNGEFLNEQELINLGFKPTNKKIYFYYVHSKSDLLRGIPELSNDVTNLNNPMLNTIKRILINLVCLGILGIVNLFLPEKQYDLFYILTFVFLTLTISIPSLLFITTKISYKNKPYKSVKLMINPYDIIFISFILIICIGIRFQ